jgi:hypothetical protein
LLACLLAGWLTSATIATFSQKQKHHQQQQQQQQISSSPFFLCFVLEFFNGNNKKRKLQFFDNNKVTLQRRDTETRPGTKLTRPDQEPN